MDRETLSRRQLLMLIIMHQIGSSLLFMPAALAGLAGQDAWLAVPIAAAAALPLTWLFGAIAGQCKGKPVSAYAKQLLGRRGGAVGLALFALCYPFLLFTMSAKTLSDFVTTVILPETPREAVLVPMLLAVVYVVRNGITALGRTAELLFPIVIAIFVLLTLSALSGADFGHMLPMLEYGMKPVLHAAIPLLAFPYCEIGLYAFLRSGQEPPRRWASIVRLGIASSGVMLLTATVSVIAVVGAGVAQHLTYASYFIVRTVSIGGFFERFEVFVSILWYVTIFFRSSLLLHIAATLLGDAARLQDNRVLHVPLAFLALLISPTLWPNTGVLYQSLQAWPYYTASFGIGVPFLFWLIGRIKPTPG